MRTHLVLAFLAAVMLGFYPLAGCAQDPAADGLAAATALTKGDYEDARSRYKSLLDRTSTRTPEHVVGYLETFLFTGEYEEGIAEAESMMANASSDPYLLYMQGRLLVAVGRLDEAGTARLRAANPPVANNAADPAASPDRSDSPDPSVG